MVHGLLIAVASPAADYRLLSVVSVVVMPRLVMWNLPPPGIKALFPALQAGLLTTGPPGKPYAFDY